jgi:hypothetical protein
MGSVRELYTTGDNDPEIEPVRYYRHYLYCDACGSFDLQPWQTPQDEARERTRHTLAMVAVFCSLLVLLLAVASLWWLGTELVATRLGLLVGVIGVAGALIWRRLLDPKIERFGMRCAQCDATYPYGTPFFTDLDANPRGLVLGDVPRPLGVSPFERGAYVGPAPGTG